MNTAFVNCLDNLTKTLEFPILLNWTTHKQTLPISLQYFDFNSHLLKALQGFCSPKHIELKRNILWDVIELDWKEVNMALSGNKINLPASVIIPLRDKFKIR